LREVAFERSCGAGITSSKLGFSAMYIHCPHASCESAETGLRPRNRKR
jgi:hypothetical protein